MAAALNSFGTFLEVRQALQRTPSKSTGAPLAADPPDANPAVASLGLLTGEFPATVTELRQRANMDLPLFTDSLRWLTDTKLVEVIPGAEGGRVVLTPAAESLRLPAQGRQPA